MNQGIAAAVDRSGHRVASVEMTVNIEGIEGLMQVARSGSFKATAAVLGISRTSLRRRLEALEASVGVKLLRRGASGVTLTPAGEIILERGAQLINDLDAMKTAAQLTAAVPEGMLRIISPLGVPAALRATMVRGLFQRPGLQIHEREAADPLELIGEPFDVMLHFGDPPDRTSWFSRVFRQVPLGLLASPAYLARAGVPESLDDLADHALLFWRHRARPSNLPLRSGGLIPVSPRLVSANLELLVTVALDGEGILFGPTTPLPGLETLRTLQPVLPERVASQTSLRVLTPLAARIDPRTRGLVEEIQAMFVALADGS